MNTENQTLIVLDRELGFVKYTQLYEVIGRAEDALESLASTVPRKIPSVTSVDGIPISVGVSATAVFTWGIIPAIKISCDWDIVDGVMFPKFEGGGIGNAINTWKAPESMELHFLVVTYPVTGLFSDCYLVASKVGTPGWYRLPMSNIYDDGKVCIGRESPPSGPTIADTWRNVLNTFCSARFNSDLSRYSTDTEARAIFGYDQDGKQIDPPENWEGYCIRVNNSIYNIMS